MLMYEIDEDLHLRMFTLDDAEEFYNLTVESKTFLKEWLGWLDNINSVEDTVKNIQARFTEVTDNKGYPKSFAIIHKGQIAGTIGYNTIDNRNRVGIIGYWIGEKYKGQGIMSQSFEAMIDYGFNVLNLNRIEVRVAVENVKSRALPERFSFHLEGTIRDAEWLYDHYVDHAVYGLLKVEWEERIN